MIFNISGRYMQIARRRILSCTAEDITVSVIKMEEGKKIDRNLSAKPAFEALFLFSSWTFLQKKKKKKSRLSDYSAEA